MRHLAAIVLLLAFVFSACAPHVATSGALSPPQGRAETQSIRNTDAVGTGGAAVADKVDDALNKTEEATKKNQEAADQAGE